VRFTSRPVVFRSADKLPEKDSAGTPTNAAAPLAEKAYVPSGAISREKCAPATERPSDLSAFPRKNSMFVPPART
jgi:hypothetical protein